MATQRLTWDDAGKRLYETGVKQGVFYPQDDKGTYPKGIAWNGLTAVTESPEEQNLLHYMLMILSI